MKVIQHLLFTITFILVSFVCNAQNQTTIDSLLKVIESDISDKKKVNTYIELAFQYSNSDSINTVKYANKAIKLANKINLPKGKINALNEIAHVTMNLGHYSKAEKIFLQIIEESDRINDQKGKAWIYSSLGQLKGYQSNYKKALEYSLKSLRIFKNTKDKKGMAVNYNNIGIIYYSQENFDKALQNFLRSLKIKEELGNTKDMVFGYNNIGAIYEKKGQYDKALRYYFKALKIFKEIKHQVGVASVYINIGKIYKNQIKYDKARNYFFKSVQLTKLIGYKRGLSKAFIGIGQTYKKQDNWNLAQQYLDEGFQIANEIKDIENIKSAAQELAIVEVNLGNYQAAYEYHVLFKEMADSLQNDEQTKKITQLELNYEFEQEKDSLQFANRLEKIALEKDIDRRKITQTATYISLGLLVFLLLTLFFFLRSKTKSNKILSEKSRELEIKNEEISQQAEEITTLNHILERDLDKTSKDLLIKNEKLEEYAYHNSHHTRAPIVNLLGLISILNTENVDADTNFILEKIKESTKQLDDITRKMNQILEKGDFFVDKNKYNDKKSNR